MASNLDYLRNHADKIGRNPSEVEVAMKAPLYDTNLTSGESRRRFGGSAEQILEDVRIYADLGVSHLIFDIRSADLSHTLERMNWLAEEVAAKA